MQQKDGNAIGREKELNILMDKSAVEFGTNASSREILKKNKM